MEAIWTKICENKNLFNKFINRHEAIKKGISHFWPVNWMLLSKIVEYSIHSIRSEELYIKIDIKHKIPQNVGI